jgi:hypothetical protein
MEMDMAQKSGSKREVHVRIAADTLHLGNQLAWQAISTALAAAGVPKYRIGLNRRHVWAQRLVLRQASRVSASIRARAIGWWLRRRVMRNS